MSIPVFYSQTSGQLLAVIPSPGGGIYGQRRPLVLVAPDFVETPADTIGAVVNVFPGDWAPVGEVDTTTAIGYGTGDDFVSLIDGESGTTTADFVDHEITARIIASLDDVSVTVYIESGVTVTEDIQTPGFPEDISALLWDASEIRETGQRLIDVETFSIASGYELRAYSGTNATTPATGAIHPIVPGTPYTTTGSIAAGSTVYNALFWRRISDGAVQMAHPVGDIISFTMLGPVVTPGFPADIGSGDWSLTEIRDAAPEGRCTVSLSSVTEPTGYQLFFAIGTAEPTSEAATTRIAPGSSTTTSAFSIAATVNARPYWKKTADGTMQAAAATKSLVIQGIVVDPPDPPEGEWGADVLVSNEADLIAKVKAWARGDETPPGKTKTMRRVVGVNASFTSSRLPAGINLTGILRTNGATGEIVIRHVGTFSDAGGQYQLDGGIDLSGSEGITITRMHINGSGGDREGGCILMFNCTGIRIHRNWLNATRAATPAAMFTDETLVGECIHAGFSSGVTIDYNYFEHAEICFVSFAGGMSDVIIRGNACGYNGHDQFKIDSGDGFLFEYNWMGRFQEGDIGSGNHEDLMQVKGTVSNGIFRQNVWTTTTGSSWWKLGGQDANQGFFWGQGSEASTGNLCEFNILVGNTRLATMGANQTTRDNIMMGYGTIGDQLLGGTKLRNYVASTVQAVEKAGTGGIGVNIQPGGVRNYTATAAYFVNGMPFVDTASGSPVSPVPHPISDLMPKKLNTTALSLHWEDTNAIPASDVLRELFDPEYRYQQEAARGRTFFLEDVGWPVAYPVARQYNYDRFCFSRYSAYDMGEGVYDGNGDFA